MKYEIEFNVQGSIIYRGYSIDGDMNVYDSSRTLICDDRITPKESIEWVDNHLDNKTVEVTIKDESIVYKGHKIYKPKDSKWLEVHNDNGGLTSLDKISQCFKYIDEITGDKK